MARLQFCDYHNMVAILEKGEFNSDFHPMVDFIAAFTLRYALTVKPTIFVSHIRQSWSTARIKTTDEGTHILAIVDGIQITVSESSLRRNLKLRDEDGIVSIPDTELFKNLTLMGTYNFSKMIFDGMVKNINNKTSKFLMYPRFLTKCLRMSQFVQISYTHQYVVNSPSFFSRIVPLFDTMLEHPGEGSGTPTEPHHTPFPEAETSHPTTSSILLPSIPTAPIPPVTQPNTTPIRQYSRRARIAQSSALPTIADEPASPVRDVSEREACPTDSFFIADQDRETIAKSSTLPHDSAPRAQEEEIVSLKERVKVLEDKEDVGVTQSGDDAPIKGKSINEREAAKRINEPASPVRDDSQGEACPTDSGFIADHDRATIAMSSTLPRDSAPRVTSPAAEEGNMQQTVNELTAFCTSLQRQHSELLAKFQAREVEINRLKERVKILEDKEGVIRDKSGDDAPIKGRSNIEREAAAERI
nr:hypothetical protein [Tanacetum cinerariifolium]